VSGGAALGFVRSAGVGMWAGCVVLFIRVRVCVPPEMDQEAVAFLGCPAQGLILSLGVRAAAGVSGGAGWGGRSGWGQAV
jgi:hypothetical protein